MDPKPDTSAPAAPWYQSPLVKYLAGVLLTVAITLLSAKLGITPQPVLPTPTVQSSTPPVIVLNVSPQPVPAGQPVAVAAK